MRCDSQGELYPVTTTTAPSVIHNAQVVVESSLWHAHLGHPGAHVLQALNHSLLITSKKPLVRLFAHCVN